MIFVDANLLLYAYDEDSPHHHQAKAWFEGALHGEEEVRIPLMAALAFIRIGTNPAVFTVPLASDDAVSIAVSWLARPGVELGLPTAAHWSVLERVVTDGQARGPLISDAHLAALVMEHGGVLYTTDRDFARFEGLKFRNPLGPARKATIRNQDSAAGG